MYHANFCYVYIHVDESHDYKLERKKDIADECILYIYDLYEA